MMDRKFWSDGKSELAYFDNSADSETTLLFLHGNSGSADTWSQQFADSMFSAYRLVAVDFPAHGLSPACLEDRDYNCISFGRLIIQFIRSLGLERRLVVVGYSMGANVAAEMLPMGISLSGLVLVGSTLIGHGYEPDKILFDGGRTNILFLNECPHSQVEEFYQLLSITNDVSARREMLAEYYLVTDGFREKFYQNCIAGNIGDEMHYLMQYGRQALIVFGENEKIANKDYMDRAAISLWRETIFKVPNAGHCVHIDQPARFNSLLRDYVNSLI